MLISVLWIKAIVKVSKSHSPTYSKVKIPFLSSIASFMRVSHGRPNRILGSCGPTIDRNKHSSCS
ncbi:hypothetical protein [Microcoleus sp. CAWBG58]|uniref:hypothetical protein n=1 Tax=Microcoleus sp. CAWBG58 TaxID=2841651 RepID=UPI0025EAF574|nr:hypothetical protein [Microcoleus sp. CAWBG58]